MQSTRFNSEIGSDVPLISSYKWQFLKRRLLQTALGGLRVWLSQPVPCYVILHQLLLFVLPLLVAVVLTSLCELSLLPLWLSLSLYSVILTLYCLTTNLIGYTVHKRKASLQTLNPQPHNLLSEEDDIEFDSCCGTNTLHFVFPGRNYLVNVFLHALLAGPVAGLGFWYLLPSETLRVFRDGLPVSITLYILGWLTLTIALYSLSSAAPPDTATFRATDELELSHITHPVHCLMFYTVFILARYLPGCNALLLADRVLHCVFAGLPVLWFLGWFPPVDALVWWGCEQAHVFLFGGSAMASFRVLVLHLLLSSLLLMLVLFIPVGVAALVTCSCVGLLLSTDLSSLCRDILLRCSHVTPTSQEVQFKRARLGFLWHCGMWEFGLLFFILLLVGGVTAVLQVFVLEKSIPLLTEGLGYGIMGLYVLQWVLGDLQRVSVLWGLIPNRLYPKSVERVSVFLKRKRKLRILGIVRRLIMNCIGPFAMVTYLALETDWSGKGFPWQHNNTVGVWDVVCVSRAFRWTWQSTSDALLDLSIVHILRSTLPTHFSLFHSLSLPTQLLLLTLARDRLRQLLRKLHLVFLFVIASWWPEDSRRPNAGIILFLNLLGFPLTLLIVAIAALLSAPVLPLFTLPVFLLGFPRPVRGWGGCVGEAACTCDDSVFYEQAATQVARVVRDMAASGSLKDSAPGSHYLLRWEDRLVWVEVLERGYLYLKVSLKGLELQETSCHSTEAEEIDDIIEDMYERSECCPMFEMWKSCLRSVLEPCDAAVIDTYSETRNKLTGVMDSPTVLKSIGEQFVKTLTWVIVGHVYWHHKLLQEETHTLDPHVTQQVTPDIEGDMTSQSDLVSDREHTETSTRTGSSHTSSPLSSPRDQDFPLMESLRTKPRTPSTGSTAAEVQTQDDILIVETGHSSKDQAMMSHGLSIPGEVTDLLDELSSCPRCPVVSGPGKNQTGKQEFKDFSSGQLDLGTVCKSQYSVKMVPPPHWCHIPLNSQQMKHVLKLFPRAWYRHIISFLRFKPIAGSNSQQIAADIAADDTLERMFAQIVMGCSAATGSQGVPGDSRVYDVYSGQFPKSELSDWLQRNPDLKSLTQQAYRLAVKLSIDQYVLDSASSLEDLHDNLESCDKKWYIGSDTEKEWKEAIDRKTPNLFSLSYSSETRTYRSRVLREEPLPVYVCSLHGESVRGQWANLGLEMLYMTNDDEERHSMQSETALLRNLTVQAADPPLGYPVYSTEPVRVPTL